MRLRVYGFEIWGESAAQACIYTQSPRHMKSEVIGQASPNKRSTVNSSYVHLTPEMSLKTQRGVPAVTADTVEL